MRGNITRDITARAASVVRVGSLALLFVTPVGTASDGNLPGNTLEVPQSYSKK